MNFEIEPACVPTRELDHLDCGGDFLSAIAPDINADAPARLERLAPRMTDREYWSLLGALWVATDVPHMHLRVWRRLFHARRPGRRHLMTAAELDLLQGLSEPVTLHRGFSMHTGQNGLAWTPDEELARAFAERWVGYAVVADAGLFLATVMRAHAHAARCFDRESMPGVRVRLA
ncbi:MAG: hypothetical protein QOJ97_112 [Solirubrobacteraceae bacterium]|jgi:hypothetical protein|nr:hypothetical protein [Solirubrobacteraceae bacterium]